MTPNTIAIELLGRSTPEATTKNKMKFGEYSLKARVYDAEGKTVRDTPITMQCAGNVHGKDQIAKLDTIYSKETGDDVYHVFTFCPKKLGTVTLTFVSGDLTQTFDVVVD